MTIIDTANVQLAQTEADLKEVQSYIADAKAAVKNAKGFHQAVSSSAKTYAPRVVKGVKWLNKNARGWSNGLIQETDYGFSLKAIPDDDKWVPLGFERDEKVDARTKVDGDTILDSLWQTALEIHKGKKSVTVPRLLKRAGLS